MYPMIRMFAGRSLKAFSLSSIQKEDRHSAELSTRQVMARQTLIFAARRALFSCLMARHFFWKSLSSACWRSPVSRLRSLGHASVPRVSVISAARPGLHQASHRRGVTPFVLFWNLCGVSSKKSCDHSPLRTSGMPRVPTVTMTDLCVISRPSPASELVRR